MLIFRLFEDTRHIGPMAERQTIADAVKCVACHFHSMPLRAGENRGLPKPAALCKLIMHERPGFADAHRSALQRSATQQSLQLWLVLFESILCWGSEGKRAVAATSSAHSSTPCCTSARETPFGVILSRLCAFYRRKTIRVNHQGVRSHTHLVDSWNEYSGTGSCIVHAEFGFQ